MKYEHLSSPDGCLDGCPACREESIREQSPTHTPTPWIEDPEESNQFPDFIQVLGPNLQPACYVHIEDAGNVAFIVRAVNAFDDLLAVVKESAKHMRELDPKKLTDSEIKYARLIEQAIAKAGAL